jgi:hypothetical protein
MSRLSARFIATAAGVLVLSVTVVPQLPKTPSLEETMTWLQSKVSGRAQGCHNYELTMRSTVTGWSDCRIDVHEQWGVGRPYSEADYSVPLKDINPDSLRAGESFLGCSGIAMATTNGKKSIAKSPGETTDHIMLFFYNADDREMSGRVIRALRYAVNVCGGAKEPF